MTTYPDDHPEADPEADPDTLPDKPDDQAGSAQVDDPYAQIRASLADVLPDDFDDLVGPTFWPEVPLTDVEHEWTELRAWVQQLVARFPHLIAQKVIPACWYRHNEHVEALVALRDHERATFCESSPGTAPAAWHSAFALLESRMKEWTAVAGCLSGHREPPTTMRSPSEGEWREWLATDRSQRSHRVPTSGQVSEESVSS